MKTEVSFQGFFILHLLKYYYDINGLFLLTVSLFKVGMLVAIVSVKVLILLLTDETKST